MPPTTHSRDIVELLPWALRRDTERYLASVRENARELFRQARVRFTPESLEELLFLAAIQKLWASINAQAWIVDSSLGVIAQSRDRSRGTPDIAGLRVGRAIYSRDSYEYAGLQRLRTDLDNTLRRLEIRDVIRKSSLVDLVRYLNETGVDRGH